MSRLRASISVKSRSAMTSPSPAVSADAEPGACHAVEVVVLQILPGAEQITGGHFPGVDFLPLQGREIDPGICHSLLDSRFYFGRELVRVEGLDRLNADSGEAFSKFDFRRIGWAVLQDTVEDVEKLGRRLLFVRREWLDEFSSGRGFGRWLAEKSGQRLRPSPAQTRGSPQPEPSLW